MIHSSFVRPSAATFAVALLLAAPLRGQTPGQFPGLTPLAERQLADTAAPSRGHPRRYWVAGAVASYLLHEAGHVASSYALGATPHFRFDKGRPTVFSGIDMRAEPHKQLVFSSMGLVVQAVLDETILDLPRAKDSPFARGMLASGLGTVLFYITAGRNGDVSDISLISRTSGLSKARVSLMAGGVAALHATRFAHARGLGSLFVLPSADGRLRLGIWK